jgi:hypothetical protein
MTTSNHLMAKSLTPSLRSWHWLGIMFIRANAATSLWVVGECPATVRTRKH